MSTSQSATQSRTAESTKRSAAPLGWVAEAEALLAVEDDQQLLQGLAALLVSITEARAGFIYAAAAAQDSGQARLVCVARKIGKTTPKALAQHGELANVAKIALSKRTLIRKLIPHDGERWAIVATPHGKAEEGGLAFVALLGHEQKSQANDVAKLMQFPMMILGQHRERSQTTKLAAGFGRAAVLMEMLNRAGQIPQLQRAMAMLADEAKRFTKSAQVSIGLGDRYRCKVVGVSGQARVDRLANPTVLLRDFMREAIAVDAPIVWPPGADAPESALVAGGADEMLAACKAEVAIASPLKTEDGRQVGAWVCLWAKEQKQALRKWPMAEALTPHLASVTHLVAMGKPRGLRRAWHRFLDSGRWVKRGFLLGALVLAAVAMLIRIPYPVSVDCRLEPKVTRQVAAPFDGVLAESKVKPGDVVKPDDVIASLDGREIGWRLAELEANKEVATRQMDQAIAKGDVAAAQLAELEARSAQLEVKLLEDRKANLEVRTPIGGLVLSGDLERSRGVPVSKGQKLFDIAPIDKLEVRLAIPDSEFGRLVDGQKVRMRLESEVGYQFETTLREVFPATETIDGENVFIGVAELANVDGKLRPGMRGRAQVYTEKRRIGWILFHDVADYVRLHWWW